MSRPKKARGRPKGSGLDDRRHLDGIAKLIAENPGLKPTTAIKKLGITDPSAVRRLRDKYRAQSRTAKPLAAKVQVTHALKSTAPKSIRVAREGTSPVVAGYSARAARVKTSPDQGRTPSPAAGTGLAEVQEVPPQDWIAVWGGLGFQALAASVDFQLSMAGHAMQWPAISAALRQQIFLSELAMSFYAPPHSSQSETLH